MPEPKPQASGPKRPPIPHFVAPVDETPVVAVDAVQIKAQKSNLWLDAWRDMRRRPMFWVAAVIIVFVALVSFFPPCSRR